MKHIINHINESRGVVTGGGDWSDLCELILYAIHNTLYTRFRLIDTFLDVNHQIEWKKMIPNWIDDVIIEIDNPDKNILGDALLAGYDTDSELVNNKLRVIIYISKELTQSPEYSTCITALNHELQHAYDDYICRTNRHGNLIDFYNQVYISSNNSTNFIKGFEYIRELNQYIYKYNRIYNFVGLFDFRTFIYIMKLVSYYLPESENNAALREFYEKVKITREKDKRFDKDTETYIFTNWSKIHHIGTEVYMPMNFDFRKFIVKNCFLLSVLFVYNVLNKYITFNFSHDNDWYAAYTELYNFCSDNNWEWSRKILGYKPNFHWNTVGLMDRDVNKVKNHTLELIYNILECIERKWLKPYLKKWKRMFYDYMDPEIFNIINTPDWFKNA